ncbi:MAG TPA: hypothetical protein VMJ32_18380 [Pirellulales bacterium]|nr:hypothetical protein [Pirellulales bacterium]
MNHRASQSRARPILLAAALALGALGLWMAAWGIVASIIDQWTSGKLWEYLQINGRGEVVIEQVHRGSDMTFRNTAGQPITDPTAIYPRPGSSLPADDAARFQGPLDWPQRIVSFEDDQTPRNFWYLVREAQPNGHNYFVGYNSQSKQRIGYLCLEGFRSTPPPMDQQFVLSTQKVGGVFAGNYREGTQPTNYTYPAEVGDLGTAFLVSDAKLFEVNFKQRSVQSLPLSGEALSVAQAYEPNSASLNSGYKREIAVRTSDKVLILDYDGKTLRTILIPPELRGQGFDAYAWWNPNAVLVTDISGWVHPPEVYWVDNQGQIVRHEKVDLYVNPPTDPRLISWGCAFLMPAPLIFGPIMLIDAPLADVLNGRQPAYAAALAHWWSAAWPALLAVCVLGVAVGIYGFRRHKRFSEFGSIRWAVFVALLGAPGLIGYLLHRRWPATEKCAHCGTVSPRNRDACLACSAEFPLPPTKGIEIFA